MKLKAIWRSARVLLCFFFSSMVVIMQSCGNEPKHELYVDASVKKYGNGSKSKPFPKIQDALDQAKPGTHIWINEGVYEEQLYVETSGTENKWIVLEAIPNKKVIVDGRHVKFKENSTEALIQCEDVSYIKIKGIEIRNLKSTEKYDVPIGLLIQGESKFIECSDLKIYHIETLFQEKQGADAHAIAVFGSHEKNAIQNILFDHILIHDCKLGSSEAFAINGNVDGFIIRHSTVRHCNNIGIDVIGHEGVCPNPELDQARNGKIQWNTVHHISSYGNPAYGHHYSAGGIYVDGGRNIIIEGNKIHDCDIGIEIASEHQQKSASDIIVRSNIIYHNQYSGLTAGGYDKDRGKVKNLKVINNTFVENNKTHWKYGEISLQFYVDDMTIANNVFYPRRIGQKAYLLSQIHKKAQASKLVIDHNLYAPIAKEPIWSILNSKEHIGFENWQKQNMDKNSLYLDPAFENIKQFKFQLKATSPAIERGLNQWPIGDYDQVKQIRKQGKNVNLGAYEGERP